MIRNYVFRCLLQLSNTDLESSFEAEPQEIHHTKRSICDLRSDPSKLIPAVMRGIEGGSIYDITTMWYS